MEKRGDKLGLPNTGEDEAIMTKRRDEYVEEITNFFELMPAWKRWGYEEGIEKGIEEGKVEVAWKLLSKGFNVNELAKITEMQIEKLEKLLIEKGIKKGFEKGREEGIEEGKLEIARKLLAKGFSLEELAEMTEMTDIPIGKLEKLLEG